MMIKRKVDKFWFPWWPDKWIFGSIRIECTPAERGIWVDLLSLASKDDGFIRANEEIPYPIEQLSGMLMVPQEILTKAIEKFIALKDKSGKGKLTRTKEGTLYVTKWEEYQLSRTAKHYAEKGRGEQNGSHSEKKGKSYYNKLNNNTLNYNKINNNKEHIDLTEEMIEFFEEEFKRYWKEYDPRGKRNKQYAKKRFLALCKKGKLAEFDKGFTGYSNFLKDKRTNEGFDQRPKYFSTLVSDYKEYIGFEYKPPM